MKRKCVLISCFLLVCCGVGNSATITVDQSGAGGAQTSITAALALVTPGAGDVIQILDSATYTEDLLIPVGMGPVTIEGGTIRPTILAANTRIAPLTAVGIGLIAAGLPPTSTDNFGIMVESDDVTLRNLFIRNDGPANLIAYSSALNVVGKNCTVDNCTMRGNQGAGATDNELPFAFFAGNWPVGDALAGGAWSSAGYTTAMSPSGANITNCVIDRGTNGFTSLDLISFLGYQLSQYVPPTPIENCTFTNCVWRDLPEECGEFALGENMVFNNCLWENIKEWEPGGGEWIFNDCVFRGSPGEELIQVEANLDLGAYQARLTFNNTVFCGGTNDAGLFRMDEGIATFNSCIFSVTDTDDTAAIQWEPGDQSDEYEFFHPLGFPPSASLTVDHCDLYNPDGTAAAIRVDVGTPDFGSPEATLTVRNSILTCPTAAGIRITGELIDNGTHLIVENNDLLAATQIDNSPGWAEDSVTGNIFEDPGYLDPAQCFTPAEAPSYYQYQNPDLGSAGTDGSDLGSQGLVVAPANVGDWSLYE